MKRLVPSLILLLAVSPARAGGEKGSMELAPYAGYGLLDSYSPQNPKDNALYGARFGYWLADKVSFEPSYQLLPTHTRPGNAGLQNRSLRFNLLYNFFAGKPYRPFLTAGLGWEQFDVKGAPASDDLGLNVGGGFRWLFTDWLAVRVDGRFVYQEVGGLGGARQYNYEVTAGPAFFFGGKPADADRDGVPDKKDRCPATPAGVATDAAGCPLDADGDGVFDGPDQCAGTPKGAEVDGKGCPKDTDGDGVADGLDRCARTPPGTRVDENGCPPDADGDGVPDSSDKCPGTPQETAVDESGCPPDADGDGVPDSSDKCPGTPRGAEVDRQGCPLVTKSRGVLKGVTFKFGSAELTEAAKGVLNEVVGELNEFSKVDVEIQGHTDDVGPVAANMKISQARAESVLEYLVSRGIDKNRLIARGFGPSKPLAPNTGRANRAANRRVELVWADGEKGGSHGE